MLRTLEGHSSYVNAVAVTPDGRQAVSASYDNTLKLWDLETGLSIATFRCEAGAHCCVFADQRRKSIETAVLYLRDGIVRNCVNAEFLKRNER